MRFERWKIAAALVIAASAALPMATTQIAGASTVMAAQVDDVLAPGDRLTANAYRESSNGLYRLVQFGDGNLVVINTATKKALWNAQTHGNPGSFTELQRDGNLVVKSPQGKALWSTRTHSNPGARLVMQDDGNAVLSDGAKVLWSSERGTFVLAAGERLKANGYRQSPNGLYRLVQLGDGNLVVINTATKKALWSSRTHDNPGAHTYLQLDGNLVVISSQGKALWSSKTHGNPGAQLVMQNDGNAVIYSSTERALWSTRTTR
ncbi:hypothetical protein [Nonomuraea sp. SYSU D8015]|uniref:hypothetical protein n=1 Tax=Nonomuraea sp. SYSU D8015 TaxID=2593644 RepID=UPI0016614249|nr:hypothetical protein [Nonomuraea sp. SYSU D8015]